MHLSPKQPVKYVFQGHFHWSSCRPDGVWELPGDLLLTFCPHDITRLHVSPESARQESVSQFFHILGSGLTSSADVVRWQMGKYEITLYLPPAMQQKESIYYTNVLKIIRSRRWICTGKILTGDACAQYRVVKGEHILWQN